jgi:hypothetical protein
MSKRSKKDTAADYTVGRGKPPRHSRFAPGQSGNPGGRKKGRRNMKTVLEDVLLDQIEMTENGQKRTVLMLEALIKRAVQEALRGNMRALKDILDRYERHVGAEPEIEEELPEEDKVILQRVLALRDAARPAARSQTSPRQDYERGAVEVDEVDEDGDDE